MTTITFGQTLEIAVSIDKKYLLHIVYGVGCPALLNIWRSLTIKNY